MDCVKEQVDFFPVEHNEQIVRCLSKFCNKIFITSTLVEWSSQTTPRTLKTFFCNIFKQSNISFFTQSPTVFFSEKVFKIYGTLLYSPRIIKYITPLYSSPFLSLPKVSPPKYSSHLRKYISLNNTITFSEMFPFSLKNFADFIPSRYLSPQS